jgi:hypothetical protein
VIGGVFEDHSRMMKPTPAALCLVALLSACHRDEQTVSQPAPAPKGRAPVPVQGAPTARESTAGMVEAASQGKSQMLVSLKFDLLQRPVAGQPLEVAIALLPQIAGGPATIEVTGSEGVQLSSVDSQIAFPTVEPEQVYRHSITVTPTAEGVSFVSLNVTLKHDEMTESRVFSVPLIVAAADTAGARPKP